jgi:cysteine desulfurase family protein (TIGR01976 family)
VDFDVAAVRARYPALADGRVWLDGAAGTQVPDAVIDAVSEVYRTGLGNQGAAFPVSQRLGEVVARARQAVADLLGAPDPAGVVFGPSTTALTYRFASALAPGWRAGDEIVVTELDHEANLWPWVRAAERAGVRVRTARLDRASGTLPVEAVTELLSERTRLVAVTAASNLLGTMPDVASITAAARGVGAVSYLDGAHHCPHAVVALPALGADFYVTSAYKWYGPHLAAVVTTRPELLDGLAVDNLRPVTGPGPVRFELGTNPFPALAGVDAAVSHLADPGSSAPANGVGRAGRLVGARTAAVAHERDLAARLLAGLRGIEGVELLPGADAPVDRRTPTFSFRVGGHEPRAVAEALARAGINVWHGHAYAVAAAAALGITEGDAAGAVRASVNHYNTVEDVSRLLTAVSGYVSENTTGRRPW